ncbi:MAG: hypothetical protein II978_03890 [Clostridia bacterium]|nr:hypothetical protein [Clostridia bacterium]
MTIHTFQVSSLLTNENFYNIQRDLKRQDPSKWKALKNGMQYWGLSDKGILINMHIIKKKGFYSYNIMYRISARRVMDNDNFVGLFNTKNYYDLNEKVNKILKDKCASLPKLKNCNLKRLDFCVNAELDNQEQVKAYIKTAKRSNVPSKLEIFETYDKKSKRKKPTKDDYTVCLSEYIDISIYNKYMEMKKEKDCVFPKSELDRAKNIVRMEIRCKEGKIKALKKKYNISTISDFMIHADKIGNDLYNYYLSRIFNNGMVCTLKDALARIDKSGFKPENINILKEFIEDANNSRSVAETVKTYKDIYGKKEVNRILFMLDLIDTNYVTVTNTVKKLFDNGYIPTPLELYQDFVK